MQTVKVKILVAVDDTGNWTSAGYAEDENPRDWIAIDDLKECVSYHWIEAEIPIPLPQTFAATVSNDGK